MRPDDLIDALGDINDQMVLDAQKLGKSPWRGFRILSVAACILCGLTLVGLSVVRLRNVAWENTQAAPSVRDVDSEWNLPNLESAEPEEESKSIKDISDWQDTWEAVGTFDYQTVVTADGIYFVDPYEGLFYYDTETETQTELLNLGSMQLLETDSGILCSVTGSNDLYSVADGQADYIMTLEEPDGGALELLGTDGNTLYVFAYEAWCIYAVDLTTEEWKEIPLETQSYNVFFWNHRIYYETMPGSLQYYSVETGETVTLEDGRILSGTAYDGTLYATVTEDGETNVLMMVSLEDGSVREVNLNTPAALNTYVILNCDEATLYLQQLTYDDQGNLTDETLVTYDIETGEIGQETFAAEIRGWISELTVTEDTCYFSIYGPDRGLYTYNRENGEIELLYRSSQRCGENALASDASYQESGESVWPENYDITPADGGVYFADPARGICYWNEETGETSLVRSGCFFRLISDGETLYGIDGETGEVYTLKDGAAAYTLRLSKNSTAVLNPLGIENGVLYWNSYATVLSTGETTEYAVLNTCRAQPQYLREGKIYCTGSAGELGYVDVNTGTYSTLTTQFEASDVWEMEDCTFLPDCLIVIMRPQTGEQPSTCYAYQVSYADGSAELLDEANEFCTVYADGDSLYLWRYENGGVGDEVIRIDTETGERETVISAENLSYGSTGWVFDGNTAYYVDTARTITSEEVYDSTQTNLTTGRVQELQQGDTYIETTTLYACDLTTGETKALCDDSAYRENLRELGLYFDYQEISAAKRAARSYYQGLAEESDSGPLNEQEQTASAALYSELAQAEFVYDRAFAYQEITGTDVQSFVDEHGAGTVIVLRVLTENNTEQRIILHRADADSPWEVSDEGY